MRRPLDPRIQVDDREVVAVCPECGYAYTGQGARLAASECCWWE